MQSNTKLSKHTFIDGDFSMEINASEERDIDMIKHIIYNRKEHRKCL